MKPGLTSFGWTFINITRASRRLVSGKPAQQIRIDFSQDRRTMTGYFDLDKAEEIGNLILTKVAAARADA